jgi:MYXO-CTERM domain-containing protein
MTRRCHFGPPPGPRHALALWSGVHRNNGFWSETFSTGLGELTIGLKAHQYYSGNLPGEFTETDGAGSAWLKTDEAGTYYTLPGVADNKPSWNPNATRWAWAWSITLDGDRPAIGELLMQMSVVGPDGTTRDPFSGTGGSFDAGGDFGSTSDLAYQNAWNTGYGFWSPAFDPNAVGDYLIGLTVFANDSGSPGDELGANSITVTAVPIPSAGVLGLAGLAMIAGVRRRTVC